MPFFQTHHLVRICPLLAYPSTPVADPGGGGPGARPPFAAPAAPPLIAVHKAAPLLMSAWRLVPSIAVSELSSDPVFWPRCTRPLLIAVLVFRCSHPFTCYKYIYIAYKTRATQSHLLRIPRQLQLQLSFRQRSSVDLVSISYCININIMIPHG